MDRFFPHVGVSIQCTYIGLLEYYNGLEKERGDGRVFDLKFINIALKGVFGLAKMADLGDNFMSLPEMGLVKSKTNIVKLFD